MTEVTRCSCWHQNFVPKGLSAPAPLLYTCIKSWKMCIKSDFKEKETCSKSPKWQEVSVDIKILSPGGYLPLTYGYYTFIKSWKDVYKVRGWRDFFETHNKWPKWWSFPVDIKVLAPMGCLSLSKGYIHTCIKLWKNVHKSRGKSYFLKHATSDQSDKTFLLSSKKCPCQNLYQVAMPWGFFQMMILGWPWYFLWRGQNCFLILLYRLCSIECSCITKFVLNQHILSTQVSDKGPVVLWFAMVQKWVIKSGDLEFCSVFCTLINQLNTLNPMRMYYCRI